LPSTTSWLGTAGEDDPASQDALHQRAARSGLILIISSERDEHAGAVASELIRLGVEQHLLDLAQFPENIGLILRYDGEALPAAMLRGLNGIDIDLANVRAVWYRRPQPFVLSPGLSRPSHRQFAYNESHEAIAGLWQMLDVFWMNHPTRDEVAARKAYQLSVARSCGLEIPPTLISNDPSEVRRFLAERGSKDTIYKAFSATQQEWRETRLVRDEELAVLDQVRHAPVIFQEYVPARFDVRVTVVGDRIFAAAIHSQDTQYLVDFRIDMNRAKVEPHDLPTDVATRLAEFMQRLGLVYGAIDMRLTPDGRYVFLEVNPAGQWLFIEGRTGQRISAAVAETLAGHLEPLGS
jgi:glutathione synthase/RimK-type ligase-like ATP-grasp enzyme